MQTYAEETGYLCLMHDLYSTGEARGDRTGTGTHSLFGAGLWFDISTRFPLLTTKQVHFRSVLVELLWFLTGDTNTKFMTKRGVTIWDEWADENGDLGPVYGKQWRAWAVPFVTWKKDGSPRGAGTHTIDQIAAVIAGLKKDPEGRRHIVSAWNVGDLEYMALPPCHAFFQFYVRQGRFLDCQLYQRSADIFLGVPFNIASYALLTYLIARVTELHPGRLLMQFGDVHLYNNHRVQAATQLMRGVRDFPKLLIHDNGQTIDDFKEKDFELIGYDPHPSIKAPVAV